MLQTADSCCAQPSTLHLLPNPSMPRTAQGVVHHNIGDDDDEVMVVGCGPTVVLVAGGSEQRLN